jgi:hypothetical protein
MGQDIKKLLERESESATHKLSDGHKMRFENKLDEEFSNKNKNQFSFLKIAASITLIISIGFISYKYLDVTKSKIVKEKETPKKINSIADISPDLKKVEDYYLTNINYQISKIKVIDSNKELLEVYFSELSVLQKEYDKLNEDLNKKVISEVTIDKLIENLQMRVLLLKQLKSKLNKIEKLKLKQNEPSIS